MMKKYIKIAFILFYNNALSSNNHDRSDKKLYKTTVLLTCPCLSLNEGDRPVNDQVLPTCWGDFSPGTLL